jgi:hypothetical protein
MRRHTLLAAVVVTCALFGARAHADIPRYINFQGRLLDNSGTPKQGTFGFNLSFVDPATGTPCATVTQTVGVSSGLFNYNVGPISTSCDFSIPYEISFFVNSDTAMTPRLVVPAASYSLTTQQLMGPGGVAFPLYHDGDMDPHNKIPRSNGTLMQGLNVETWAGQPLSTFRAHRLYTCNHTGADPTRLISTTTCDVETFSVGCPACTPPACPSGCTNIGSFFNSTGTCPNTKPMNECGNNCRCPSTFYGFLR